ADMETKYETDKKDLEISSLSAKKQFFIMMTLSCIIIIILLIATLLLLQRYQRQKQLRMKEHLAKLENEKQLIATQSVLKGEDAERERLSRELHDGLGGLLTIVKLDLGTLRQSVNTQFNEIDSTIALMDQSIEEMRRMSHSLMPESLHHFGLKSTLEDFCRKNTLIHFHFFGEERRFEQNIEINFYRIGCELINNALKHANATQINVQLITSSTKLSLTVQDNGKGFDIQKIKQGLATVRARADMLNATLNIFSNPTHGSEIIVDLELPPLS
ncbi:MAG: histidine kinase, partial [Bacteroidales bacterium]